MLEHEETMRLVRLAKTGDEWAKETLLIENSPLIKSIIKRFKGKGVDYDDLFQLASLGFMKAVNNFDERFEVRFSTYVVPMVLGEVKRFMRDDGAIKVSRAIKMQAIKIIKFVEEFKCKNERDPTLKDIASEFSISPEDAVFAMDSLRHPLSIYEKIDDDSERSNMIIDKIKSKEGAISIEEKIILKDAIMALPDRERKIIILRYFRDKTQGEIAGHFGLSQVQISRIESKIMEKLKKSF